ncbi:MAG: ABC transporter substrate-binding protein, partial [Lachnospiraceae bacterium]|nr:ABC transporter substrate-binding protein [Lachnospiraceae bacterium]
MPLQYAENFSVDYYAGGYMALTTLMDGKRFLLVPEKAEIPVNLAADIVVIKRPVTNIYLVASAVMDSFCALDGLSSIAFSGQRAEGWYIDEARKAMEDGDILYAGKYNKPDYELIVSR